MPGAWTRPRYVDCNLSLHRGVYTEKAWTPESLERAVFSCDYNGWADVPEDEREAIEAFELSSEARAELPSKRLIPVPAQPPKNLPHRKAA